MDVELCIANYSHLPPHIITQILGYLKLDDFKNASIICKAWHYASTSPQIVRTLILKPKEENFPEICKSNRRYGVLKLNNLAFNKVDSYYFELFENFCPFIYELHINTELKLHHLLKLLELTKCLETFSFSVNGVMKLSGIPFDYEPESKLRIMNNLSGVKNILIDIFISNNISIISDLVRYATNLETFKFSNKIRFDVQDGSSSPFRYFCNIFDNNNIGKLTHLDLNLNFSGCADDFITSFIKIKNLKLKSFNIVVRWPWKDDVYKRSLFRQFILKLQSLEELTIHGLRHDQLSIICQYLVNLKSLDCLMCYDQAISELRNLKQLEKLCCRFAGDTYIIEIDKFFHCKFEYLRVFNFEECITEFNLVKFCTNHPHLLELRLTRLLSRNLEPIFLHLTKLRVLILYFETRSRKLHRIDLSREYAYKISRLQDLEEFYVSEWVSGIHEEDMKQLKKLQSINKLKNVVYSAKLFNY